MFTWSDSRSSTPTRSSFARRASFFFFNATAPSQIYTLSLHDALPIFGADGGGDLGRGEAPVLVADDAELHARERAAGARLEHHRSEEHTSELQSLTNLVCRLLLEKKNTKHPSSSPRHDTNQHISCTYH